MTRVPYTLASYPGDPKGLDAKELDRQLQALHWCAVAHGLVHADFRPANLGLTEQQQLKLLDWGASTSSICFEKLPKAAADAVLLCLQQLTQGVIDEAIAKLGHKTQTGAKEEPNRSCWWPFA
jgi:predicted unusual protein kinase regulating ubiquinone biosynthesis (AarF/ABC1/UbiB family)